MHCRIITLKLTTAISFYDTVGHSARKFKKRFVHSFIQYKLRVYFHSSTHFPFSFLKNKYSSLPVIYPPGHNNIEISQPERKPDCKVIYPVRDFLKNTFIFNICQSHQCYLYYIFSYARALGL